MAGGWKTQFETPIDKKGRKIMEFDEELIIEEKARFCVSAVDANSIRAMPFTAREYVSNHI